MKILKRLTMVDANDKNDHDKETFIQNYFNLNSMCCEVKDPFLVYDITSAFLPV